MPLFFPIYAKLYYGKKGHKWYETMPEQPIYCNICSRIVLPYREKVLECQYCGSFSHRNCFNNISYDCKHMTSENPHEHQWVEGNIPISSICSYCGEDCVSLMDLTGFRCMWCQCCLHSECLQYITSRCCFGVFSDIILSPDCVRQKMEIIVKPKLDPLKIRQRIKKALRKITPLKKNAKDPIDNILKYEILPSDDKVILFMINKNAGGLWGGMLLPKFRQLLNPLQVCDLATDNPMDFLETFKYHKNLRIVVCGGDGSVNWVSGLLDVVHFNTPPPIGVLPLGTGNDMSRTLHWGKGYDGEDLVDLLVKYKTSHICSIDRWNATIRNDSETGENKVVKKTFNCYWGVGLDAGVTMKFHNYRHKYPHMFTSRFGNTLWYTRAGVEELLSQPMQLNQILELECDGKLIEMPNIQCLVFININHYCGGVEIYPDNDPDHSYSDGKLDVYGLNDTLHTGMMYSGLSKAIFITKCESLTLHVKNEITMQMDGEPWIQKPATFHLTSSELFVLQPSEDIVSETVTTMTDVLMWGQHRNIINSDQYKQLLTELTRRIQRNNSISNFNY